MPRARRLMREALTYWRRYERVEKEQRRRAEKEALEQRKIDDEMREVGTVWKKYARSWNANSSFFCVCVCGPCACFSCVTNPSPPRRDDSKGS